MCGIVGFLQNKNICSEKFKTVISNMAETLVMRGPDDTGTYIDKDSGIALGHRRLSVLDISESGRQPMKSISGRYKMVYNGEIYNFEEIRKELESEKIFWRGNSDTEVALAAIEVWGLEQAVKKFNGMFAFALWDSREQILSLCRDRLGIKPLYYAKVDDGLIFGSELKAIIAHPAFRPEIDRDALSLFFRYNCIPAPSTIYKDTLKLRPGHIIKISRKDLVTGDELLSSPYWSCKHFIEDGQINSFTGSSEDAVNELESLLRDSVKKCMLSDVPLGAFLSGGIDSSIVVALMQEQSIKPVKTFSIGSTINGYNEAEYAKDVASHLGTEHTELYVNAKDAVSVIPELPLCFDEPFSDSSQIPTYLVSKLARKHVTVSLSGDGGDELFGGYNRHLLVPLIWRSVGWLPPFLKKNISDAVLCFSPEKLNNLFYKLNKLMPSNRQFSRMGDKLHKLAGILPAKSPELMYRRLCSHWVNPENLVINCSEPLSSIIDPKEAVNLSDFAQTMMYLDLISYLPDDILTKVDRTTMALSLEGRVPLLDYRVVEFALKLPVSFKIKKKRGKWILRQILKRYLPEKMIDRPKMGFGIPIDAWLRGPLRDWCEDLLDERKIAGQGLLNHSLIREKWTEHLSGCRNWQYELWDVLMFQAWLSEQ